MKQTKFDEFTAQFVQQVERAEKAGTDPALIYENLLELEQEMRRFSRESDVWEEVNNSSVRYDLMQPLRDALDPALNRALYSMAVQAGERPECREAFRTLAIDGYPKRFDLLAVVGDRESFRVTCEDALKNLKASYYDSNPASLEALTAFAQRSEYRQEAIGFMGKAFPVIETSGADDGMINHIMYGAVACCMGQMKEAAFLPELCRAFEVAADEEGSYSLNREAGTIAMAMAALGHSGDTAAMEKFLESYEWRYSGEEFILKTRYALWLIRQDAEGVAAYLANRENTKSLGLVAAALADMNAKAGLPVIKERFAELKDPVAKEVFKEAIHRLSTQDKAPAAESRMIHLFGTVSATQRALGWESDNVFLQRAIEASKNAELGIVYEDDESARDD